MYSRVYVEITTICNRNCTFCPGTKRERKRMSMEEFACIVEKLKGVTTYLYLHVMGEPLTHPLLPEFVKYATQEGFRVSITTKGTLLAKQGEALLKSGVYKVNISVHSFEEGSNEEYLRYISECMKFADEASKSGILTVLRLWNKGFDEGRNINTLTLLQEYFANEEWKQGGKGSRVLLIAFAAYFMTGISQALSNLPSYFPEAESVSSIWRTAGVSCGFLLGVIFCKCRKLPEFFKKIPAAAGNPKIWKYTFLMVGLELFAHYLLLFPGMDSLSKAGAGAIAYPLMVCSCLLVFDLISLFILKEKHSPIQWTALALCFAGVAGLSLG